MKNTEKIFTLTDPKEFDGNPFEVSSRALLQSAALAQLLAFSLDQAEIQVLNSYMERNLNESKDPNAKGWDKSSLGRRLGETKQEILAIQKRLAALATAAGYDPKNPPA